MSIGMGIRWCWHEGDVDGMGWDGEGEGNGGFGVGGFVGLGD